MLTVLALGMMASAAPWNVEPKIVSASMFKNGYAVVYRQFNAPSPGTYVIERIPQSAMGTLWFTSANGMKLEDVTSTKVFEKTKGDIATTKGILAANVGRQVRLGIKNGDKVSGDSQEGELVSVGDDFVIIRGKHGTVLVPTAMVTSLSAEGGLLHQFDTEQVRHVLRIRVTGKAGRVGMVSLERGMTWSPAYAIDISDPKKLTVVAKATVLNDIEDVANIEARFVTGFPNVPFAAYLEPLVTGGTVTEFGSVVSSLGVISANSNRSFGGGGGFAGQMAQNAAQPVAGDFAEAMSSSILGTQQEDLFIYKQPNLTSKQGDRTYLILFKTEAPYSEVYTLDLADGTTNNVEYRGLSETPPDVWHSLKFKNTSGQPLTTGIATTFKNGEILGQDTMHYVSAGGRAEVKITKALDVHAEADEAEVSRERAAIKQPNGYPMYDLVTLKGTIRVSNSKPKTVTMRIKKELTGEIIATEGSPEISKTAKGLRSMNPGQKIEWNADIESGKSLTLTYSYKLYVRSG
jgi:hypothetical protein